MPDAVAPIDILLSYAFHRKRDHRALHARLPAGSLLWIDSGAYTAYTTGKTVTVSEYADHLHANRGGYDYAFTLDVIGDHRQSMKQTEELLGRGLRVVPIFTYGTPISEFRAMCRDFGYIGAGGLVPLAGKQQALVKYLRHLTRVAGEYGTAVHALGTAGRSTVIASKVWSADSSTVSSAPLYGKIPLYSRSRRRLVMLQATDVHGLYRYRDDLLRYGFPLGKVMAEGKWTKDERPAMFRASLLSVADMWADVRRAHPVPAPERLWMPETWRKPATAPSGPRVAHAAQAADVGDRMSAALGGPRAVSALTTSVGVEAVEGPRGAYALGPGNERGMELTL